MAEQYIVIGNGIAGVTAAETLRAEDASADITVVADDPFPVYYRPALKDYLAGRVREDKLWARPTSFYQDQRIRFLSERVSALQVGQHRVQLQSGRQLGYSRLLLACGARASSLRCPGVQLQGVTTLRTVADYQAVQQYLRQARHVVVSGSGTLALETIETLRLRGFEVTHLVRRRTLWSEILDLTASDLVLQQERRAGVDVRTEEEIAEITGKDGQVTGIVTSSGARLACESVLIAIGIEPNIDFIKSSGIPCERGVIVDQAMRTAAPDVYAAGDVLETVDSLAGRKRVIGQWFPAVQQARAAAYSMLDLLDTSQPLPTSAFYNATFLYGLDFACAGLTQFPTNAQGYQEIVADPQLRTYRKVLLKDGVAVGALALGNRMGVLACKRAIDHHVNLTSIADRLFAEDFRLNEWLDQQGVPPAVLSVSREGAATVRQAASSVSLPTLESTPPLPAGTAFLVPAEIFEREPQSIPASAQTLLSQTRVITIGRQAGVTLLIDHDSVSRRHAEISYNAYRYVLRDTGSSNGTFVNKTRLPAGAAYVLQHGEYVRFGKVTYVFVRKEPLQAAREQATVLHQTQLTRHATGFFDPSAWAAEEAPSVQPLLKADGSLLLPGANTAIAASEVAAFKVVPALVAVIQGIPHICHLKPGRVAVLGRDQQNELPLPDMSASRKHAEVFYGSNGFYLRDLDSSNGVQINRTKIANPYRLTHGDCIQIGGTQVFFFQPDAQEEIPTAQSAARGVCPMCGISTAREAHFCAHCGADLKSPVLNRA